MKGFGANGWVSRWGSAMLIGSMLRASASAQCAMCKTTAEGQAPEAVRALNFGILTLLIPPLLIFSAFFVLAFREIRLQGSTNLGSARVKAWSEGLLAILARGRRPRR
ncbi:MAG: hypothetical protein HY650_08740 [Acidobacteria bacterium]|nr:hypothetical protein [Acidobacteriota bacterium]